MYLASAGVGRITVLDPDTVDLTNLQRQIVHTTARIGQPKVTSAAQMLHEINPGVTVQTEVGRADAETLRTHLDGVDVVLDCSDNFTTRHAANAACIAARVPLVFGAAVRWDGQLATFDPHDAASPCYACLFPPDEAPDAVRCATLGVFAPLVGQIGCAQAAEALRLLAGLPAALVGRLQLLDARQQRWTELRVPRRLDCPVCGHAH